MSHRIDQAYVQDVFLAAQKVRLYIEGFTKPKFMADSRTQDAVLRQLLVIGEAAGSISDDHKTSRSDIDWRGVVAFRNLVVHHCWQVDLERVWGIVKKDIPDLVRKLKKG